MCSSQSKTLLAFAVCLFCEYVNCPKIAEKSTGSACWSKRADTVNFMGKSWGEVPYLNFFEKFPKQLLSICQYFEVLHETIAFSCRALHGVLEL